MLAQDFASRFWSALRQAGIDRLDTRQHCPKFHQAVLNFQEKHPLVKIHSGFIWHALIEEAHRTSPFRDSTWSPQLADVLAALQHDETHNRRQRRKLMEQMTTHQLRKVSGARVGRSIRWLRSSFVEIDFAQRGLDELGPELAAMERLEQLNVSRNELRFVEFLPDSLMSLQAFGNRIEAVRQSGPRGYPSLVHVGLGYNRLKDVSFASVERMPKLVSLDVSFNQVVRLEEDVLQHLRGASQLRYLWLKGNPCALLAEYRKKVIRALPQLVQLDGVDTVEEREEMEEEAEKEEQQQHTIMLKLQMPQLLDVAAPAKPADEQEDDAKNSKKKKKKKAKKGKKGKPAEDENVDKPGVAYEHFVFVQVPALAEAGKEKTVSSQPVAWDADEAGDDPVIESVELDWRASLKVPLSVALRDQLLLTGLDFVLARRRTEKAWFRQDESGAEVRVEVASEEAEEAEDDGGFLKTLVSVEAVGCCRVDTAGLVSAAVLSERRKRPSEGSDEENEAQQAPSKAKKGKKRKEEPEVVLDDENSFEVLVRAQESEMVFTEPEFTRDLKNLPWQFEAQRRVPASLRSVAERELPERYPQALFDERPPSDASAAQARGKVVVTLEESNQ